MSPASPFPPLSPPCPHCGNILSPPAGLSSLCRVCGASLLWQRDAARGTNTPLPGLHLKPFSAMDREITDLEVFRILAPAGWARQSSVRWQPDTPAMPATVAFQIANPYGQEAFEALPEMSFTWNGNPLSGLLEPARQNYFGAAAQRPVDVRAALEAFVLPACRSGAQDLSVLNFEPQPDLPRLARSEALLTLDGTAEGGKMRLRYTGQEGTVEEDLYGVVEVFRTLNPGMFRMTEADFWFINHLFSFRSAAGRLDATADLFAAMLSSFRLNPAWYAAVKTIAQALTIKPPREPLPPADLRGLLAKAPKGLQQQYIEEWAEREKAYQEVSQGRPRSVRPLETCTLPHTSETVALPPGYAAVWTNAAGEILLTGEAVFKPGFDSSELWERLEKV